MDAKTFVNPQMIPQRIEGQKFVGANVQLDGGVAYINCEFIGCTLIYLGMGSVQTQGCKFDPTCRWNFTGPAANTISFLRALYVGGQKELVERLFEAIRSGAPQPEMAVTPGPPQGPIQ
jgi:hypothetical protein